MSGLDDSTFRCLRGERREEVRDNLRLRLCGVPASMIVREDVLKIDGNAKMC